ncbi:MAG TPA: tetratricopeptide repeat protein [Acidimicrobiia bacterium]|nr:tetratricopeptide repeat protein [Acidimicrobiia bacterium]
MATGSDVVEGEMQTMNNSPYIVDVTEETFDRDVLERSAQVPVVVDFWAAWCGPCKALGPVLERLAVDAGGAWVLAKVDVDTSPRLAGAFRVQGIPAVRAFKDGREVAEFTGALPEPEVRKWLEQLGPSPADLAYEEGAALEAAGRLDEAAAAYRRALAESPGHNAAGVALNRVELAQRTAGLDRADLERRAGGGDIDALLALADLEAQEGEFEPAFGRLVDALRRTAGDDRERIRQRLVALLDVPPPGDPRVTAARRAMASALF